MKVKMKKLMIILVCCFTVIGCDLFRDSEEDFISAYKEILLIREKYKNDSLKAEKEINKIYEEYGFTQESFKDAFFEIAHKDTRKFYNLLDSIREKVRQDLINKNKKKDEAKKE